MGQELAGSADRVPARHRPVRRSTGSRRDGAGGRTAAGGGAAAGRSAGDRPLPGDRPVRRNPARGPHGARRLRRHAARRQGVAVPRRPQHQRDHPLPGQGVRGARRQHVADHLPARGDEVVGRYAVHGRRHHVPVHLRLRRPGGEGQLGAWLEVQRRTLHVRESRRLHRTHRLSGTGGATDLEITPELVPIAPGIPVHGGASHEAVPQGVQPEGGRAGQGGRIRELGGTLERGDRDPAAATLHPAGDGAVDHAEPRLQRQDAGAQSLLLGGRYGRQPAALHRRHVRRVLLRSAGSDSQHDAGIDRHRRAIDESGRLPTLQGEREHRRLQRARVAGHQDGARHLCVQSQPRRSDEAAAVPGQAVPARPVGGDQSGRTQ